MKELIEILGIIIFVICLIGALVCGSQKDLKSTVYYGGMAIIMGVMLF